MEIKNIECRAGCSQRCFTSHVRRGTSRHEKLMGEVIGLEDDDVTIQVIDATGSNLVNL